MLQSVKVLVKNILAPLVSLKGDDTTRNDSLLAIMEKELYLQETRISDLREKVREEEHKLQGMLRLFEKTMLSVAELQKPLFSRTSSDTQQPLPLGKTTTVR